MRPARARRPSGALETSSGEKERVEANVAPGAGGVAHHAARGDSAKLLEELAELGVVDGVLEVLDVEVGAGHLLHAFAALGIELGLELSLTLRLLLGAADDPGLVLHLVVTVELLNSLARRLGILEANKAEALGLAFAVLHHHDGGELAVLVKHLAELVLVDGLVKVLDVDVVEGGRAAAALAAALEGPT